MQDRLRYALILGIFLGLLGGGIFFVWGMIDKEFVINRVIPSTFMAMLLFAILGFILGYLIYKLEP